jgi:hypothetical protein
VQSLVLSLDFKINQALCNLIHMPARQIKRERDLIMPDYIGKSRGFLI